MAAPAASRNERILENFAIILAVSVILMTIWAMSQYALHAWPSPGSAASSPANPAGIVLAALSALAVLVRIGMNRGHGGIATGRILAAAVLGLASLKLVGTALGVDVMFDSVLFAEQLEGPPVNRLTILAAVAFVFLGGSLLLQFTDRLQRAADFLAAMGFLIFFQGAVGYVFGARVLTGFGWERPVALHSVAAMIMLALSVMLARPNDGLTSVLADDGAAGAAARRLMPAAFAAPFVVGLLFFAQAEPLRLAYVILSSAVLFCAILAISISKLLQIDRQRLKAIRDISERSAKDRALMENIGDGVFAVDTEWRITFWNKGAERITGFAANEAVGKPLREVLVIREEESREENMAVIDRAIRLGEVASLRGDSYIVSKDGREVPIGDSSAPVPGTDGKGPIGAIVVFRDTSDEKRLAKLRQDFLFRTIHDLRSPANIISLLIHDFNESNTDIKDHPDVIKGIRTINDLNERMRHLVEDLQEVAKGTDPAYRLRLEPTQPSTIVEGLFAQYASTAKERNMRLVQELPAQPFTVMADQAALLEVLENLIGNAIKYGRDGGTIRVTQGAQGGSCRITVWNDGSGIAAANLPLLFDAYFRVAGTGKPGTGLGLFIVRQLIEKMGGKVSCESEFGEWTAFSVTLPLA